MEEFALGVESEALMGALEVVREMLQGNSAESLQLKSDMKNDLEDAVDLVYNTYKAREIYQSALERMVSEVDWSDEDLELLKLHNGGRYWETLDADLAGDVDDFVDKVWGMFGEFAMEINADFDASTLSEYVSTDDMLFYLEDGLKERYGY